MEKNEQIITTRFELERAFEVWNARWADGNWPDDRNEKGQADYLIELLAEQAQKNG